MPRETEEPGEAGVLGPEPPPMSPTPLSTTPPAASQRDRSQDTVGPAKGAGIGRSPRGQAGREGGTSRFLPLTSASSKYTQRVILCRIMLLAYSSCLHSRELRSLRSSPESRPCRSRSIARPRQPPQPGSGWGLRSGQRMGLGRGGEGPGDKAALPFLKREPPRYMHDHHRRQSRGPGHYV